MTISRFYLFFAVYLCCIAIFLPTKIQANESAIDVQGAQVVNGDMLIAAAKASEDISRLKTLAEYGNYYAQFYLGAYYYEGIYVTQSYDRSFEWFFESAKNGHFESMTQLAHIYGDGIGPIKQKDLAKKEQWLKCAAVGGGKSAQHFLGLLYGTGKGNFENFAKDRLSNNEQNLIKAHMWLNLAASKGYPKSAETRDQIASIMSRKSLAKAQSLASSWVKQVGKCKVQQDGE